MDEVYYIDIAEKFSDSPAGRYIDDGDFCGEIFLKDYLLPNIKKYKKLVLDFTNVLGYGSSFLEEAFGGLVRETGMSKDDFESRVEIKTANDPFLLSEINDYVDEELSRERSKK
ncbi:STAS-like domain-containing protein [Acinetobacter guillouiae]|uniref:STAS-like domain-containing protein n=1 Tax=Acinetobacter guillouiae TaxID=106649 RepID=UPI0021D31517|nr:STAS-like domain-containing protein [Acinetobacter guillouiae]MCU4494949.1 STAS-like domain-containing protein [Acinetobacter guillouiae]